MADKLTPSTAPHPTCCDTPAFSINETMKTCTCLKCSVAFTFDGGVWVKPVPASAAPKK